MKCSYFPDDWVVLVLVTFEPELAGNVGHLLEWVRGVVRCNGRDTLTIEGWFDIAVQDLEIVKPQVIPLAGVNMVDEVPGGDWCAVPGELVPLIERAFRGRVVEVSEVRGPAAQFDLRTPLIVVVLATLTHRSTLVDLRLGAARCEISLCCIGGDTFAAFTLDRQSDLISMELEPESAVWATVDQRAVIRHWASCAGVHTMVRCDGLAIL